jgi:hypothetical protein
MLAEAATAGAAALAAADPFSAGREQAPRARIVDEQTRNVFIADTPNRL